MLQRDKDVTEEIAFEEEVFRWSAPVANFLVPRISQISHLPHDEFVAAFKKIFAEFLGRGDIPKDQMWFDFAAVLWGFKTPRDHQRFWNEGHRDGTALALQEAISTIAEATNTKAKAEEIVASMFKIPPDALRKRLQRWKKGRSG